MSFKRTSGTSVPLNGGLRTNGLGPLTGYQNDRGKPLPIHVSNSMSNGSTSKQRSSSDSSSEEFDVSTKVRRRSRISAGAVSAASSSSDAYHRHCDKYGFFVEPETDESKDGKESKTGALSMEVVLKRERKWIYMCDHWEKFMSKKWKKIRNRCRKGIPNSVRGRAWFHLCAAFKQYHRHPDLFHQTDLQVGDEKINDEIRKDLNRQFPSHEMFAENNGHGQQDLYRVLKAYSIIKPKIGYCQGQAPLASVLLMQMPAEHAFWSLVQICDHYLPGYFSPGLEAIQIHGAVLNGLIKRYYPSIYKHLKKQSIDPILYMTEWFMCVYSRTLPWPSVLRVWDMFMCEGIVIVFKVALILIGSVLSDATARKKYSQMYDTLHALRNLPAGCTTEEYLVNRIIQFDLSNRDLEKEHAKQVVRRKKEQEQKKSEQNGRQGSAKR